MFGVVGLLIVGAGRASATPCSGSPTILWTGAAGTSWLDAANWNETGTNVHRLPGPSDDIALGNG